MTLSDMDKELVRALVARIKGYVDEWPGVTDESRAELLSTIAGEVAGTPSSSPALHFGPQEIRDHFEGGEGEVAEWIVLAEDEELAAVGEEALWSELLMAAFHSSLTLAIQGRMTEVPS